MKSFVWDTFLRIPEPATSDVAPSVDAEWLSARGINPGAPALLQRLREDVLPLVRRLEKKLDRWFFLVHDRSSGVPCLPSEDGGYVHLRLSFKRAVAEPHLPGKWQMTRAITDEGSVIGGVDLKLLQSRDSACIRELLAMQSAWVLRVVEWHRADADEAAMLKQVRQLLHYFSNMTQMRVA